MKKYDPIKQFTLFVLIQVFCVILMVGCTTQEPIDDLAWGYRSVDYSRLTEIENYDDGQVVDTLVEMYKKSPWEKGYDEIVFRKAFREDDSSTRLLFFGIRLVSDTNVVFELDSNGIIVENYIVSTYSR